jgi:hypothetical protein
MPIGNLAKVDDRSVDRDAVHHRARGATLDGRPLPLLIVNISPHGLMARCEAPLDVGEAVRITLPLVGQIVAEVRWALGGRIGCQFRLPIPLADYYGLIAALLKA